MKNKVISLFLAVMLLVPLCFASATATGVSYDKLYLDFLNSSEYYALQNISGFIMCDLNVDGIPELFTLQTDIEDNGDENHYACEVFVIEDSKVKKATPWGRARLCLPSLPDETPAEVTEKFTTVHWYDDVELHMWLGGYDIYYDKDGVKCVEDGGIFADMDCIGNLSAPVAYAKCTDTTPAITMFNLISKFKEIASPVRDAKVSDWAKGYVETALDYGLIPEGPQAYEDYTELVKRDEFAHIAIMACAKVLNDIWGLTPEQILPHYYRPLYKSSDFEENNYANSIRQAVYFGLITGCSFEKEHLVYLPEYCITREDIATIMGRVISLLSKVENMTYPYTYTADPEIEFLLPENAYSFFDDVSEISDYAKNSVLYLASENVINGVGDNLFAPKNYATREEALTMAVRLCDFIMSYK